MYKTTIAGRLDEIVRLLAEIRDGLSCPQPCSQLRGCVAQTKEEKEPSPRTPHKETEETGENNRNARTREKFVKPRYYLFHLRVLRRHGLNAFGGRNTHLAATGNRISRGTVKREKTVARNS